MRDLKTKIIISADDRTGAGIARTRRGLRSVSRQLEILKRQVITIFSVAAAARVGRDMVRAYQDQEQAVAALNQSLRSMGRTTVGLSGQLQALATQIQSRGIIGDEAIIRGQSFLTTYGKISDDLLPRTTRAMADLAAKMGGDTVSAANLLGRASEGLVGELTRVGISLSEEAKQSKDFRLILRDIESQVGGMNEALAATATGSLQQLSNSLGDLKEIGGGVLAEALLPLTGELRKIIDAQNELAGSSGVVREWGRKVGRVVAIVADVVNESARLMAAPFEIVGKKIGAFLAAMNFAIHGEFRRALDVMRQNTADTIETLGELFDPAVVGRFEAAFDRALAMRERAMRAGARPGGAAPSRGTLLGGGGGAEEDKAVQASKRLAAALEQVKVGLSGEYAAAKRFRDAIALLDRGLKAHLITQREFQEYARLAMDEFSLATEAIESGAERQGRALDKLGRAHREAFRELRQAVDGWARDFATRMVDGSGSFRGFVDNVLRELQRIAIAQATQPLFSGFSSLLQAGLAFITHGPGTTPGSDPAAFIGAHRFPVGHAGGVLGRDRFPMRRVPALAFAGAPRLHTGGLLGLGPDEVPIIAQRGEEVLTRSDPRHRDNVGATGGVSIVYNIDARGADAGVEERIREAMRESEARTLARIQEMRRRGGSAARALGVR